MTFHDAFGHAKRLMKEAETESVNLNSAEDDE